VTLEAFHSHKPLLTFTDSGGTNELVEHGRNGLVVEPEAEALAEAMEALWTSKKLARDLGEEAHATLGRQRIDWECVLDRLTAA
jgi:glycosyltransferase involved in cell wall biosynthesis